MIRSYRIYRNMNKPDKTERPVCLELLVFPNPLVWLVSELEESVAECCPLLHEVPLPKWLANIRGRWDENSDEKSRFGDWYGDDWGSLWHVHVETPLSNYVFQKTRETLRHIHVTLEEMGDDPEVDWIKRDIAAEVARLAAVTDKTPCECAHPKDEHGPDGKCTGTRPPFNGYGEGRECYCEEYRPQEPPYDWRDNAGTSLLFKTIEFITRPLRHDC